MGRASLKPKLAKIYGEIRAKHGRDFSNATLGRWDFWSYDRKMPREVIDAADKLGVSQSEIEYFTNEDDPDAFDDFGQSLLKSDLDYEFGTFKTDRGRPLNFAIVINK